MSSSSAVALGAEMAALPAYPVVSHSGVEGRLVPAQEERGAGHPDRSVLVPGEAAEAAGGRLYPPW